MPEENGQADPSTPDDRLVELYEKMRRVASTMMRHESSSHTLQTTALANEAYMRLQRDRQVKWQDDGQFFGAAAEAMRRVLIDHARKHLAAKRGGNSTDGNKRRARKVSFDVVQLAAEDDVDQLVDLNDALEALAAEDERSAEVVRLRIFAGLEVEKIGDVLGISERTVRREWTFAKTWLYDRLSGGDDESRDTS
ncbi:MAG: ECF-type sigma factor [Planctomycetota bacterium]